MTTLANDLAALLAGELTYPGVEEDTGFRVLEVRALDSHVVVVGQAAQNAAVIGYALDAARFVSLFGGRIGVAAGAFGSELREPGGSGEEPPASVACEVEGRYFGIRWITPALSLHKVLTSEQ